MIRPSSCSQVIPLTKASTASDRGSSQTVLPKFHRYPVSKSSQLPMTPIPLCQDSAPEICPDFVTNPRRPLDDPSKSLTFASQLFSHPARKSSRTTADSAPTFLTQPSKTNPAPAILRSENSPLPRLEHDSVHQSCAGKSSATPAAPTANSAKLSLSATSLRTTIQPLATPRSNRERSSSHAETDARSPPSFRLWTLESSDFNSNTLQQRRLITCSP